MKYPANVILLLLQIILRRQQILCHRDVGLNMEDLRKDPIIDNEILHAFQSHKLTRLYAPDIEAMTLRGLKSLAADVFSEGIPSEDEEHSKETVDILDLANYYYNLRIEELENQLPKLKEELLQKLQN
ncbi:hypothetical protein KAFR_0A06020 [Kazachstania africana CBS 2517]|uniref:Uncharacterized protein n=1 Tax=Kazachstania africana (strain ATCC 22294 / BCRC 22015 / CBS 2517 / CECT 1963 / NBRC 1671 / NRRL Y-8276) TaxID=1071382 RepID=H2ANT7_KAZAF|nr:hypothetical protein KAFR_0A06020 [Kazachstania africana CBS 2517]CCF56037.1 hypothetical protein KAFR_0A06020 [Kazachstania africana CBS 2517]